MSQEAPHILCINPWIHDFAAHDFWARPLGLLYLASMLRSCGLRVSFIDCLDRFHPERKHPGRSADGRGAYRKTPIDIPSVIPDPPGRFFRYGIEPAWFEADLRAAGKPDIVLVTSLMTYWYTGVQETVAMIRHAHPGVPVWLGGIYATLLPEHARASIGADEVLSGAGEKALFDRIEAHTGFTCQPAFDITDMNTYPYPALDMQSEIAYAPILTARGCPNQCAYCASRLLQPVRMRRDPVNVAEEIFFWHDRHGVRNFAYYDDALLWDAENHAIPFLEAIVAGRRDLSFHTPNALHVEPVTRRIADLMYRAGFHTVRLGLETALREERVYDNKVRAGEFERAVRLLLEAGFDGKQVGAYLLAGLPGQDLRAVEASIDTVLRCGIQPVLAWYTPIPGTRMWDSACAASRYDLAAEPLFTNNSLLPCMPAYDRKIIDRLKQRALRV